MMKKFYFFCLLYAAAFSLLGIAQARAEGQVRFIPLDRTKVVRMIPVSTPSISRPPVNAAPKAAHVIAMPGSSNSNKAPQAARILELYPSATLPASDHLQ